MASRDESYDNDVNNKDESHDINNGHDNVGETTVCDDLTWTRSLFEVSPGRLSLAVSPAEYIYFLFFWFCFIPF